VLSRDHRLAELSSARISPPVLNRCRETLLAGAGLQGEIEAPQIDHVPLQLGPLCTLPPQRASMTRYIL